MILADYHLVGCGVPVPHAQHSFPVQVGTMVALAACDGSPRPTTQKEHK